METSPPTPAAASRPALPRVLFGPPPGRAYVYLSYGIHECLNGVAEPAGAPGCVLLPSLTPLRRLAPPLPAGARHLGPAPQFRLPTGSRRPCSGRKTPRPQTATPACNIADSRLNNKP